DGTPWRRPRPDGIPPELADEFRTTFLGGGVTQLASVAKLKAQFALKQYAIAGVVAAASAMLGDNLYQFARALYARFIGH
ncbi:MAG: hypothetical protein P4L84_35080, partial [Isosphaeraceae bacterium]|nr:hypothetical protein [Isosphaeraceae bacterium]